MFKRAILLTGVFLLATCSLTFGQPAQLWETGQTTCYDSSWAVISCSGTGQDGELRAGVAWPDPRFTSSGECVADKLTGLMWAKNADLPNGTMTWQQALDYVASLNSGSGLCSYHDWRLPNLKELRSLIDYSQSYPAWPLNHPFQNNYYGNKNYYWSSSSVAGYTHYAWTVGMKMGFVFDHKKDYGSYVWPVRTGQVFIPTAWIYLPLILR
jgi:hypothetical protein